MFKWGSGCTQCCKRSSHPASFHTFALLACLFAKQTVGFEKSQKLNYLNYENILVVSDENIV